MMLLRPSSRSAPAGRAENCNSSIKTSVMSAVMGPEIPRLVAVAAPVPGESSALSSLTSSEHTSTMPVDAAGPKSIEASSKNVAYSSSRSASSIPVSALKTKHKNKTTSSMKWKRIDRNKEVPQQPQHRRQTDCTHGTSYNLNDSRHDGGKVDDNSQNANHDIGKSLATQLDDVHHTGKDDDDNDSDLVELGADSSQEDFSGNDDDEDDDDDGSTASSCTDEHEHDQKMGSVVASSKDDTPTPQQDSNKSTMSTSTLIDSTQQAQSVAHHNMPCTAPLKESFANVVAATLNAYVNYNDRTSSYGDHVDGRGVCQHGTASSNFLARCRCGYDIKWQNVCDMNPVPVHKHVPMVAALVIGGLLWTTLLASFASLCYVIVALGVPRSQVEPPQVQMSPELMFLKQVNESQHLLNQQLHAQLQAQQRQLDVLTSTVAALADQHQHQHQHHHHESESVSKVDGDSGAYEGNMKVTQHQRQKSGIAVTERASERGDGGGRGKIPDDRTLQNKNDFGRNIKLESPQQQRQQGGRSGSRSRCGQHPRRGSATAFGPSSNTMFISRFWHEVKSMLNRAFGTAEEVAPPRARGPSMTARESGTVTVSSHAGSAAEIDSGPKMITVSDSTPSQQTMSTLFPTTVNDDDRHKNDVGSTTATEAVVIAGREARSSAHGDGDAARDAISNAPFTDSTGEKNLASRALMPARILASLAANLRARFSAWCSDPVHRDSFVCKGHRSSSINAASHQDHA